MSSENLPLIFDPFDDVTPQGASTATAAAAAAAAAAGATAAPRGPQLSSAAMATGGTFLSEAAFDRPVTVETEEGEGPSHPPPMLLREWMPPWQTSGPQVLEPSTSPGPTGPPPGPPLEHHAVKGTENDNK